jgi:hypothetical protein
VVGPACADETSDDGTTGLSSDTCYQVLASFAEGVTECASSGEGKEFVTPECKTAVRSRVDAECGFGSGDGGGSGDGSGSEGAGAPSGSDACSMVNAACADETSSPDTTGLSSDTCYQVLGSFAQTQGVTECASLGTGKEAVTPECKASVMSRVYAECGSGGGDGAGSGGAGLTSGTVGLNGEQACEGRGLDEQSCLSVGCCQWNPNGGGDCWSDVGTGLCHPQFGAGSGDGSGGRGPGSVAAFGAVQCVMFEAECAGESVNSTGIASETCYQIAQSFAQGVTECMDLETGKEAVTPECKSAVVSLKELACGGGMPNASSVCDSISGCREAGEKRVVCRIPFSKGSSFSKSFHQHNLQSQCIDYSCMCSLRSCDALVSRKTQTISIRLRIPPLRGLKNADIV